MANRLSKGASDSIRTFLAVEIPESLRRELGRVESLFNPAGAAYSWSAANLLHITVRFLGNIPSERIVSVTAAAEEAGRAVGPFTLSLSGVGAFPDVRMPRVLWVGLRHDGGYRALQVLFSGVERALVERGFGREPRAYTPHVTLARARERATDTDRRAVGHRVQVLAQSPPEWLHGSWRVAHLIVMRSDLTSTGPRYAPLATVPLGER